MKARTRRNVARARRALDFATAHPLTDSGYSAAVASLNRDVAQADTLGRQQADGIQREHAAKLRRNAIRRQMRARQLKRLATLARLNAADHPELNGKYPLPPAKGPGRAFQLQAQSILANATEQKDLLSQLGVGDTILTDLAAAIADYDTNTVAAHNARADHTGASKAFQAMARRCDDEVELIGSFIQDAFANDEGTLGAWASAQNLAGPFTRKSQPPAPSPMPSPTPPAGEMEDKAA